MLGSPRRLSSHLAVRRSLAALVLGAQSTVNFSRLSHRRHVVSAVSFEICQSISGSEEVYVMEVWEGDASACFSSLHIAAHNDILPELLPFDIGQTCCRCCGALGIVSRGRANVDSLVAEPDWRDRDDDRIDEVQVLLLK